MSKHVTFDAEGNLVISADLVDQLLVALRDRICDSQKGNGGRLYGEHLGRAVRDSMMKEMRPGGMPHRDGRPLRDALQSVSEAVETTPLHQDLEASISRL